MSGKFNKAVWPLLIAVCVVGGMLAGICLGRNGMPQGAGRGMGPGAANNKLTYTLQLIERMYVDPVNMDSISEHVIPLMLEELDPHSVYIPASEMAGANETLDGQFDGIGVVFNMSTDTVVVLNVIPSGPSDMAGVKAGDRIIRINDSLVAGQKIDQNNVVKMLRGVRGTQVELGIQRSGIKDLVPIIVTRGIIPIKSIDAGFMLRPGVGFVKLSSFSRNSHTEMMAALERMRGQGMQSLIFDLRGNTGGFLDQAILIVNEFLPADRLIVYTLDRNRRRKENYSDGKGRFKDLPLAVLIDEQSASASEILAGAVQDNDRGVVIGRRSFGKGLVQEQLQYPDHSALRLTIARYYTPAGRSIQKPYDKGRGEYALDLQNRFDHNEFFSADSIRFADSLRFETAGGRTVYGGGGIMPDIFIPLDTADMTRYYLEVSGRNILYRYTMEYADKHRAQINAVEMVGGLNKLLDSDRRLVDDFVAYAARHGVAPNAAQIARSRAIIAAQLRANIARNTPLEDAGFFSQIYVIDKVTLRALDELKELSAGEPLPGMPQK
ncbi:MAG: S41 family peptidase [Rikenellaceae bacterium]|jgi:carboxyl-terminal processing protease|nr:S41 family peptidase [Rikenellaceae bacterium]